MDADPVLPAKTMVMGVDAPWDEEILKEWKDRVAPRFKRGETCEAANFYRPRPWVDEYNRGSPYYGFTYTVCVADRVYGRDVAYVQWLPSEEDDDGS